MKIFCIERSAFLAARVQLLRRDFAARFASIPHANKLDSVSYRMARAVTNREFRVIKSISSLGAQETMSPLKKVNPEGIYWF